MSEKEPMWVVTASFVVPAASANQAALMTITTLIDHDELRSYQPLVVAVREATPEELE
jgi:hypothetical protein